VRVAAGICYVVSFLAEVGGVLLVVGEARKAVAVLRAWEAADNPLNMGQGTWAQVLLMNRVVRALLDARVRVTSAVVLLLVGVIAGTLGNFLTL
jgi:hypothetical protein